MISRTLVTIYENRDFAKTPPCFTSSNQKKSRMSNTILNYRAIITWRKIVDILAQSARMEQGCPSLLSEFKNRLWLELYWLISKRKKNMDGGLLGL